MNECRILSDSKDKQLFFNNFILLIDVDD